MSYGIKGHFGNHAYQNVTVPRKIRCVRCGKSKGHHSYAKTRITELQQKMYKDPGFDATKAAFIPCAMCTGSQQLELECIGCDRTLPHTRFSKVQRRSPDHARCEACQRKLNEPEPGAYSSDDHDNSDDDDDDFGDGVISTADQLSSVSLNGSSSAGGVYINSNAGYNADSTTTNGKSSITASRAPSASNRNFDVGSNLSKTTMGSGWTTTTAAAPNPLPASRAHGIPPHLRNPQAGPSAHSIAAAGGGVKFDKIKASDASSWRHGRPQTNTPAAPATAAREDDDIGVASSESDED